MDVGKRIKDILKDNNMSGNQLANIVGLSSGGMSKILNDKSTPKIDVISKIAKELNTSTDYLILGDERSKDAIENEILNKFRELNFEDKKKAANYITNLWMEHNRN